MAMTAARVGSQWSICGIMDRLTNLWCWRTVRCQRQFGRATGLVCLDREEPDGGKTFSRIGPITVPEVVVVWMMEVTTV